MSLLPGVERELRRVADGRPPRRRPGTTQAGSALVALVALGLCVGLLVRVGDHARPTNRRPSGHAARLRAVPRPSPGAGFVCPRAPAVLGMAPHLGCASVLHADLVGDGRPDLIVLYARLAHRRQRGGSRPRGFVLELAPSHGGVSRIELGLPDVPPALTRVGALHPGPGRQLVVELAHYSSGGVYGIFAVRAGRLVAVTTHLQAGGDSAYREQFRCRVRSPATVVQSTESLLGPGTAGRWRWAVTTWRWAGGRLRRVGTVRSVRRGEPQLGPGAFGGGCGRALRSSRRGG